MPDPDGARGLPGCCDPAPVSQARAWATRRTLLRAGGEQFAAAGYEATTLRAVVAHSGLTKGALYFHFTSKPALAHAVVTEMIAIKARRAAEIDAWGLDPLPAMITHIDHVTELMVHDPIVRGGTRLLNDPAAPTALAGSNFTHAETVVRGQLAAAAAAGLLRPTADIPVLADTVVALVAGHALVCERTGHLPELPTRLAEFWPTVLPLIATDAWLADHAPTRSTMLS